MLSIVKAGTHYTFLYSYNITNQDNGPKVCSMNRVSRLSLQIQRINYEHQILYVTGNVPGHKKGILKVRDSVYNWTGVVPPFPTNFQKEGLPVEAYSGKIHQPDAPSIKFPDMRKLAKK